MRIRWTPAAAADLEQISNYLREHHPHYRQPTNGLHSGPRGASFICVGSQVEPVLVRGPTEIRGLFALKRMRDSSLLLSGLQVETAPVAGMTSF